MFSLHGLPRLGIGSIGSLGVFREVQDAIEVVCHHFAGCHSATDVVIRFFELETATRFGVAGYAAVLVGTAFAVSALAKVSLTGWVQKKAHALVESQQSRPITRKRGPSKAKTVNH